MNYTPSGNKRIAPSSVAAPSGTQMVITPADPQQSIKAITSSGVVRNSISIIKEYIRTTYGVEVDVEVTVV